MPESHDALESMIATAARFLPLQGPMWFRVFGGPVTVDAPRHAILPRERIALTGLLVILFGLGLYPGPFVRSLDKVAASLLASRHHDHAAPASSGDHR
jgi:NADH:ubiquinone oxidoreductase subunit 4 (subunit M)